MPTLKEALDEDRSRQKDRAIEKWNDYYDRAGFSDYAIDFSEVDPELIERIGMTIKEYLEERERF